MTATQRYRALQRLARDQGRATDEVFTLYALEGFLRRLAATPHANSFVLKGGVLLAAYDARRPTRDIDVQALDVTVDEASLARIVGEVAAVEIDDSLQ